MLLLVLACQPGPTSENGVLVSGAQVTCANPDARKSAPFDRIVLPEEVIGPQPSDAGQYDGAGTAVADFDGDGFLDFFLPNTDADQLYLGQADGTVVEASERLPARAQEADRSTGASTADVDGDGDADLFIADQGGDQQIWLNQGGTFETADLGVAGESWHGVNGTFGDMDGDGDLDLFVINHYEGPELPDGMLAGKMGPGHPDRLYENQGNGQFVDVSERLPAELLGDAYSLAGGWIDADGDHHPELYVVNDFGGFSVANRMLKRKGDTMVSLPATQGLDVPVFGMGLGIGDLNDDGIPDFAVTSWDQLVLLQSMNGRWYDAALARHFTLSGEDRHVAWGTFMADLDNDGDLDIPVSLGQLQMPEDVRQELEAGMGMNNPPAQRDALYIQSADGNFVESAEEWGVADDGVKRGAVAADIDRDGWLDLIKRDIVGPTLAYHARCGSSHWLEVGFGENAVGARVEVTNGDRTWRRWVTAGGESFASGGPMEVHFGLGDAEMVDLRVIWPDGEESRFTQVPVDRRVVAARE